MITAKNSVMYTYMGNDVYKILSSVYSILTAETF